MVALVTEVAFSMAPDEFFSVTTNFVDPPFSCIDD